MWPEGTLRLKQMVRGRDVDCYLRYIYYPDESLLSFKMFFLSPPYDILPELLPKEVYRLTATAVVGLLRDERVSLPEEVEYKGSSFYIELRLRQL